MKKLNSFFILSILLLYLNPVQSLAQGLPQNEMTAEQEKAQENKNINNATPESETNVSEEAPKVTTQLPPREDPFEPPKVILLGIATQSGAVDPNKKNLTDLEKYDVADISVVGILWNVKEPKALLKLPSGSVYVVYRKTKVGVNNGYISDISEGAVEVTEHVVDEFENKVFKEVRFIEFKTKKNKLTDKTATMSEIEIQKFQNGTQTKNQSDLNLNGGDNQ